MKILVLDDEEGLALLLAEEICEEGSMYNADWATSCENALSQTRARYDWLIIDVALAGGDNGYNFGEMYSTKINPMCSIIFMSHHRALLDEIRVETERNHGYINVKSIEPKPLTSKRVVEIIHGKGNVFKGKKKVDKDDTARIKVQPHCMDHSGICANTEGLKGDIVEIKAEQNRIWNTIADGQKTQRQSLATMVVTLIAVIATLVVALVK